MILWPNQIDWQVSKQWVDYGLKLQSAGDFEGDSQ